MEYLTNSAWLPWVLTALLGILDLISSAHAILNKKNSRSAVSWVGFIWFVPGIGAALYWILGVNRIRRQARQLRWDRVHQQERRTAPARDWQALTNELPESVKHLASIARTIDGLTSQPLVSGNTVTPLRNGEAAYPVMLEAIDSAKKTISLATYLFDNDELGQRFVAALAAAVERGVEVRVLVDDLGARYSWRPITRQLARGKIPYATFLPILIPWRLTFLNLRNHRKTLVVDGRIGFTGGMNIRFGHLVESADPDAATQDLHFRLEGPVVRHLQEVFADDWQFTTREPLRGNTWFPELATTGSVFARGISDGPDGDLDNMSWTLSGALACARSRVMIVTPYFLPDAPLLSALNTAAMRGVAVDIILPSESNLPYVQWATRALLWQVLKHGCRVWVTPQPFDHSKLVIVDGHWTLLGSTNWDPRALRLNFEFNVECYDRELGEAMQALAVEKLESAREVTLAEVDGRSLPTRLRDGIARLLTPYL